MKQFFLSIVTLLMFSVFLSGCIIAEEEPIEEQDEFGIYHVPTNDAPETKFGDNSLRDEFTTIMSSVNNETASFDLPALAVQHNNAGNTKTVSNFIAPVFSVSYYRDNNFIGISEAMVHVGEKKYGVFNLTSDGTETYVARNNEVKGAGSNASAKLTINNSPFGFAFNNMLSVEWELHKIVAEGVPNSSEYGYMIAGLETDGADIPITSEAVTFEGKGKGKYDSSNDVDFTAFDVTADINFATRNIALATEDTKNADDEALAYLDFTSTLNYRAGTNNISGTVSTNGMSGFIDARFYSSTGVPLELGGTFAMRNDESVSYIGMFGAANTDTNTITVNDPTPKPTPIEPEVPQILNPKPTEPEPTPKPTPIAPEAPPTLNPKPTEPEPTPKPIPTPPNTTIDNIDIIQVQTNDAPDAITDIGSLFFNASVSLQENTAYDVTLSALAVQQNDSGTAKTVSNIISPILALTFSDVVTDDDDIRKVTLYAGENQYKAPTLAYTTDGDFTGNINNASDYDSATITIDRKAHSFEQKTNFEYDDLVYVEWALTKNPAEGDPTSTATTEHGYMIAGNEASATQIGNALGNATFTGFGKGRYDADDDIYFPAFNVTAAIEFANQKITLTTSNTSAVKNDNNIALPQLNFTSILTYDDGKNNIAGITGANGMSGMVDARFYSSAGELLEFGGTFAMQSDDSSYIGAFAASGSYFGITQPPVVTLPSNDNDIITIETNNTPDIDQGSFAHFFGVEDVANRNGNTTRNYILPALAVQQDYSGTYSRASDSVAWGTNPDSESNVISNIQDSVASLSYYKQDIDAVFYVGGNEYNVENLTNGSIALQYVQSYGSNTNPQSREITGTDGYDSARFAIAMEPFGFILYHSIYVEWGLRKDLATTGTDSTETAQHGYMVTGTEMSGSDIPTGDTVAFVGGGNGRYDNGGTIASTTFDVVATVAFSNRSITLATRDTKDLSDDTALSQLDFATNLTYEHRTNNIKGNVSSDDMVGTMDARFYQQSGYKNQPIEYGGVIELGGTFSMRDDNKSYIGAFIMNNNDGK